MTDVDEGTGTKFGVRASTTFVGATQALVSLTPTKNGSAAFLAVADTETIPSATAAETLLAYREINFSGTSPQIIQFALSISATQDATSGVVSGGTAAVLQPSTAYKIVMYSSGSSTTLLTFTTLGHLAEGGYAFGAGGTYPFDISAYNFRTGTDGKFQVPFVFSWVMSPGLISEIGARLGDQSSQYETIGNLSRSNRTINSSYTDLANAFGNSNRGAIFLHTPRSGAVQKYRVALTNGVGDTLSIFYN
ncbi:hypothetical protein P0082_07550 [Candidatus Haliotispira prima]|uniref:Uncharacterized protein n=1 Tax=Candidatus Haliotispira prima TaxID=3034016 RepID=A0ABY8MFL0_9SPIO|nr:hypothetical protein P0082_07550 [Candidatus Haliotispira prima]